MTLSVTRAYIDLCKKMFKSFQNNRLVSLLTNTYLLNYFLPVLYYKGK